MEEQDRAYAESLQIDREKVSSAISDKRAITGFNVMFCCFFFTGRKAKTGGRGGISTIQAPITAQKPQYMYMHVQHELLIKVP